MCIRDSLWTVRRLLHYGGSTVSGSNGGLSRLRRTYSLRCFQPFCHSRKGVPFSFRLWQPASSVRYLDRDRKRCLCHRLQTAGSPGAFRTLSALLQFQMCIRDRRRRLCLCCRLLYYRNSYFFYSSGFHPETYHSFCCGNSSDAAYPDRTEAFDRRISSSFFSAVFYSCYMDRNGLSVSLFQKKIRFLLFRNYFKEFPDRQKHLPELVFLPGCLLYTSRCV